MNFSAVSGQERVKKILKQAFLKNRIPSAYLFVGPDRDAAALLAVEFAKLVNCKSRGEICGSCENCDKIERGIHPDVLTIRPDGSSIKIDQVRELVSFTRQGPAYGMLKVVIVEQADNMTAEAYGSFLKTLEEPTANVVFVLIALREDMLPKTVISRCQKIILSGGGKVKELSDEEKGYFDQVLSNIGGCQENDLIDMSEGFLDTEEIKDRLNNFMVYLWQKASSETFKARNLLDAFQAVSQCYNAVGRNANLRLAMDVMFLNLKEAVNG